MTSVIGIDILMPMADGSSGSDAGSGREGRSSRLIRIWVNSPSHWKWQASPDQLPGCQSARFDDGDQRGEHRVPGGSVYFNDKKEVVFKLQQIKPGSGLDKIRPSFTPREGVWVNPPFAVTSASFEYVIASVDGEGPED